MSVRFLSGVNIDSNTLFVDDVNNRVGIGTGSPVSPLDVNGIISSRGIFIAQNSGTYNVLYNASNSVSMYLGGSADPGNYYDNTTHYFRSSGGGTTYAVINYLGNVGIGTTSPSDKLTVSVGNVEGIRVQSSNSGFVEIGKTNGARWRWTNEYNTANIFELLVNDLNGGTPGQNVFTANGVNGNVGIGTTSPSYKLDVNGDVNIPFGTSNGYRINGNRILSQGSGFFEFGALDYKSTYPNISTNSDGTFRIQSNGSTLVTVNQSGNVGIGTTSTFGRLQISGTVVNPDLSSATATGVSLVISNSDTGYGTMFATYGNGNGALQQRRTNTNTYYDFLLQPHGGNVGIGTTSPLAKLQVSGGRAYFFSGDNYSVGLAQTAAQGNYMYLGTASDGTFYISETSGTARVTVQQGGNVGIGTTSPSDTLDLYQAANTTAIRLTSAGVGSKIYRLTSQLIGVSNAGFGIQNATDGRYELAIDGSGNVGIGTTSPTSIGTGITSLDIQGSNAGGIAFGPSGTKNYIYGASTMYVEAHTTAVFSTSGTEKMRLTTGGQLIVGGTTVGYAGTKLQVGNTSDSQNGLNILTSTTGYGYILFGDGAGADTYVGQIWYYHGDNYMAFQTNGSEKLRITSAGNVGIGTTAPGAKLHLSGAGATELRIASTTGNTNSLLSFYEVALASWGIDAGQANGSFFIKDLYNSATRLTILNSGNVGIGTTSPAYKTSVVASNGNYWNGTAFTGTPLALSIENSEPGGYDPVLIYNQADSGGTLKNSGAIGMVGTGPWTAGNNASQVSDMYFLVRNSSGSISERLRIKSTGATRLNAYGSGSFTGTVAYNLAVDSSGNIIETAGGVVDGSGTANYVSKWSDANTLTDSQLFDNGTSVGIGTASPSASYRLTISGSTYQVGTDSKIYVDNGGVGGASAILGVIGTSYGYLNTDGPYPFVFQTNNTERMRITSAGNVGIGTTAPSAGTKLQVEGNVFSNNVGGNAFSINSAGANYGFILNNSANTFSLGYGTSLGTVGTSVLTWNSSGNVGIGTTAPESKLHVVYGAGEAGLLSRGPSGDTWFPYTNGQNYVRGVTNFDLGSVYFTGGNVGIGTTAPQDKLTVKGATNYNLNLGLLGGYSGIYVYNDASSAYNHLRIDASPLLLNSYSGSNVAIAAGSAITRLTIGAYSGARLPYINGTANTFDANGITVTSSNTANAAIGGGIDLTNNVHSVGSFSPLISFSALSQSGTYNNNYAAIYGILAGDSGDGNWNSGHLVFATALAYGASEKMRITNAGNVGIGTTSPANKLVAVADATFNGENSYAIAAASSTDVAYKTVVGYDYANDVGVISAVRTGIQWKNLSILPVGNTNLGVGTLSPSQRLHVSGNIRVTGAYYDSSNSAGSSGQVLSSTGSGTDWVSLSEITGVDGTGTANYIAKWSDTDTITNSQVFDNGTNVGINNASPKTKLDVNGQIGFGSKSMSITDTFAAALTINMFDHHGCYVKLTAFGDWANHSTIAYLGEFFIQASAGAYNEPGIIIRQVDNTGGGDDIQAQIVDPAGTGTRDFVIQLKATSASNTPFTAYLQYEVRGLYNSVS